MTFLMPDPAEVRFYGIDSDWPAYRVWWSAEQSAALLTLGAVCATAGPRQAQRRVRSSLDRRARAAAGNQSGPAPTPSASWPAGAALNTRSGIRRFPTKIENMRGRPSIRCGAKRCFAETDGPALRAARAGRFTPTICEPTATMQRFASTFETASLCVRHAIEHITAMSAARTSAEKASSNSFE